MTRKDTNLLLTDHTAALLRNDGGFGSLVSMMRIEMKMDTCTDKNQINLCCSQSYMYTYKNQNKTEILYLWRICSKCKQTHTSYDYKHIKLSLCPSHYLLPTSTHAHILHSHTCTSTHAFIHKHIYTHTENTKESHHTGKLHIEHPANHDRHTWTKTSNSQIKNKQLMHGLKYITEVSNMGFFPKWHSSLW